VAFSILSVFFVSVFHWEKYVNEKVQKDKQPSTKRQLRVLPTLTDPIGVFYFLQEMITLGWF
jgi:hypothetical protein